MVQTIIKSLENLGMGSVLITFIVSMLPIVELRGAIPVGVALGLYPWAAMIIALVGNMVPIPIIIVFIRKIFQFLRRHFSFLARLIDRIESSAAGKQETVLKYGFWGLMIFVAIPLPGTGAWTGALVAALLGMRLKSALPSILLGVVIAGFLVTGLTFAFTAIFS